MDGANLIASTLWSAVGLGFVVYGKRQKSAVAFLGGVAMIAVCYCVDSPWIMSLLQCGLIPVTVYLERRS